MGQFPSKELTPNPDVVAFPQGVELANGWVVSQKRDNAGTYHVEFDDSDVAELTANIIAQSMYSQCNIEGNQYLLLDTFVDYRKSNKALMFPNRNL